MPQRYFVPDLTVNLPYDFNQNFKILNDFMNGNSYSLINVNLGRSSNPEVEREILDVAGYGKQLGRIGDVMRVLMAHFRPERPLTQEEDDAIVALRAMLMEIEDAKDAALRR